MKKKTQKRELDKYGISKKTVFIHGVLDKLISWTSHINTTTINPLTD